MGDTKKKLLNAALCKHAFTDSVETMARIAAFTTSRSLEKIGLGEYYNISEELLKKDIILFAISIRRLSELTNTQSLLKSKQIKIVGYTDQNKTNFKSTDNCWNIIGNIIHSSDMIIYKSNASIKIMLSIETDIMALMGDRGEVDAAILIILKNYPSKFFLMVDFCIAINDAMEEINDAMADNGIYLGSYYE